MQKVVFVHRLDAVAAHMQPEAFRYIGDGQFEGFISFDNFSLLGFDWYDIHSKRQDFSRLLIYIDEDDILFICKDELAYRYCTQAFSELRADGPISDEQLFYRFFVQLFRGDVDYLERLETAIDEHLTALLEGKLNSALDRIIATRKELLRLKHYYAQINTVFDDILLEDDAPFGADTLHRLNLLDTRTDRYLGKIENLQALTSQMQDVYQSQLAIQQNDLMKVFTIITAIFMPLTLLVGWYGMNFANMPELHSPYGYPTVIVISILLVISLFWYFKHKKWL